VAHLNVTFRRRYKPAHDALENVMGFPTAVGTKIKGSDRK
jgi:hypothetical protein